MVRGHKNGHSKNPQHCNGEADWFDAHYVRYAPKAELLLPVFVSRIIALPLSRAARSTCREVDSVKLVVTELPERGPSEPGQQRIRATAAAREGGGPGWVQTVIV